MERAYKLRDERERVRNEHVKASLDKQWRDACDDARTLDSEALLQLVSKERHEQTQKKIALNQKLTAEEREHTAAWLKHVEAMEAIENQKDIDRLTNERQTASLISLQVNIFVFEVARFLLETYMSLNIHIFCSLLYRLTAISKRKLPCVRKSKERMHRRSKR
jgi:hypothetical protein